MSFNRGACVAPVNPEVILCVVIQSPQVPCKFGAACYDHRINHRLKYQHPTQDHMHHGKPEWTKKPCKFGAACHNRDIDHRHKYQHHTHHDKPEWTKKRCKHGAACHNLDIDHRHKYLHLHPNRTLWN